MYDFIIIFCYLEKGFKNLLLLLSLIQDLKECHSFRKNAFSKDTLRGLISIKISKKINIRFNF